jgi:hypothetical protein
MTQRARVAWLGAICLIVLSVATALAPSAGALTEAECDTVVAEGKQARDDLAKLIEAVANNPATTNTTSAETGSYVADLLVKAQINEFGFVSADAGAPLELCLPEGTTKLLLFSDPVVLYNGPPASAAQPLTVTIPAGLACGTHTLTASGARNGAEFSESSTFNVAGSCATPASVSGGGIRGALPFTGAELGRLVGVSLALIALGYAAVRGARRSRATS